MEKLILEYKNWMIQKNKSEGTIKNYLICLKKIPENIEKQKEFLLQYRKNRMMISAYRSFLKFLRYKRIIDFETLYELLDLFTLPKKRGESKTGKSYHKEEWNDIIAKAPNRVAKFGIWLGFNFGLRISEILFLRTEDIDFENRIIRITAENRNDKWHPKHYKERQIPMNQNQFQLIKRWIEEIRSKTLNHNYLLFHPTKEIQVETRTFQRWCKNTLKGLKSHNLRRSYATNLYYLTGKDIKIVQKVLGHSSVGTTSNYLKLEDQEYQNKVREVML